MKFVRSTHLRFISHVFCLVAYPQWSAWDLSATANTHVWPSQPSVPCCWRVCISFEATLAGAPRRERPDQIPSVEELIGAHETICTTLELVYCGEMGKGNLEIMTQSVEGDEIRCENQDGQKVRSQHREVQAVPSPHRVWLTSTWTASCSSQNRLRRRGTSPGALRPPPSASGRSSSLDGAKRATSIAVSIPRLANWR